MKKKKMLYASPFSPLRSGISDYSEALVEALSEKYDITLYIDDYKITSEKMNQYSILRHNRDEIKFSSFDHIVYNIGNNPEFHSYIYEACKEHPGMIILHDYVLYYLFTGFYQRRNEFYSKTYELNGVEDFLLIKKAVKTTGIDVLNQKEMAAMLPFNKELLRTDNKIMVHSQYAFNKVKKYTDKVKVINMIQQVTDFSEPIDRIALLNKYKIPTDAFIITSFGLIAETKLNHVMCEIMSRINWQAGKKICYIMVGEGDYVDSYVDHKIIFKTGFVNMDEFNSFIVHSDLVLNLRHPSMGETSAALMRIMQMGKPCIIVDEAWFAEIPDLCAIKLSVDNIESQLEARLLECIEDEKKLSQVGLNAAEYIAEEYAKEHIVDEIEKFLNMV